MLMIGQRFIFMMYLQPSYIYDIQLYVSIQPHCVTVTPYRCTEMQEGSGQNQFVNIHSSVSSYEVYRSVEKKRNARESCINDSIGRKSSAQKAERKSNRKLIQPNLSTKILVNPFLTSIHILLPPVSSTIWKPSQCQGWEAAGSPSRESMQLLQLLPQLRRYREKLVFSPD